MNNPTLCQYIFIPKKPKMSKGKIASQVSKVAIKRLFMDISSPVGKEMKIVGGWLEWLEENGMMTIVLQVKNQVELHNVVKYLQQEKQEEPPISPRPRKLKRIRL